MTTVAKLDVLPSPQRILDIDPPEKPLPLLEKKAMGPSGRVWLVPFFRRTALRAERRRGAVRRAHLRLEWQARIERQIGPLAAEAMHRIGISRLEQSAQFRGLLREVFLQRHDIGLRCLDRLDHLGKAHLVAAEEDVDDSLVTRPR